MTQRLLGIVVVAALLGCKAPAPSIDPFLGRQTVVPPRPGEAVAALPAGAYYPSGPAPATARQAGSVLPYAAPNSGSGTANVPAAPAVPVARPAATPVGDSGQPPATLPIQSAVNPRPLRAASPDEASLRVGPATSSTLSPAVAGQQFRAQDPVRPAPQVARQAGTVSPPRPLQFVLDGAASDISQWRGAVGAPVTTASHETATGSHAWNAVSRGAQALATGPAGGPHARYGFEPDYSRLEGQLEFLQSAQRWKLRYIPLDGQSDQHGGSVVLLDTPLLDSFHPGDFVTLHGEVAGQNADTKAFAPLYRVQRIERAR